MLIIVMMYISRTSSWLAFFILTVVLVITSNAFAREEDDLRTLQVIGSGIVHNDDVPAARDKALADSLATAVQQMAIELLPHEALVKNFDRILALLDASGAKFVQDYRIMAETRYQDSCQVLVKTTLSVAGIEKELKQKGLWAVEPLKPKILLLAAEKKTTDPYLQYEWETLDATTTFPTYERIKEILTEEGFSVIDQETLHREIDRSALKSKPFISDEDAVKLAIRTGADAVILADSTVTEETLNMLTATLKARILFSRTGREAVSMEARAHSPREFPDTDGLGVLSKVAADAAEKLGDRIQQAWVSANASERHIELEVSGSAYSIGNFISLRRMLNGIPETKAIQTREIQSTAAFIMIDFNGDAHALAKALMNQPNNRFSVNIENIDDRHLKIILN